MPNGTQSKGACVYCAGEITRSGATKHLNACPNRRSVIATAEKTKAADETLHHLRAQDAGMCEFWLDLEMRGSCTLEELDFYLRGIWLECCGHASRFSIGGWRGEEIPKKSTINKALRPGKTLTHIYDFGTESKTLITPVKTRVGKPTTKHPIALMARNLMPEVFCLECGRPASFLCIECQIEDDTSGWLCDIHARNHRHDEYGDPIPLVNSPRLGLCGYDGPAIPPY